MSYQLILLEGTESPGVEIKLAFACDRDYLVKSHEFSEEDLKSLRGGLETLQIFSNQNLSAGDRWIESSVMYPGNGLDASLRSSLVYGLRGFIESVTPLVAQIEKSRNE